jgi:predicted enzyme related to lactoylglutathione lyase
MRQRSLHRSFGDAGQVGQSLVAHSRRFTSHAVGMPVKLKIDEKGCAGVAVRHQVAHQRIDNIGINFHGYSNYSYSRSLSHFAVAVLISCANAGIVCCMIKRIKFLGIPVHDQDRALRFYTEKLGMRVLTDQEFTAKQRWIELSIPGAETGIALFTPEGHEDRIGTHINTSWEVDNIEKTYEELVARGVEFVKPPQKQAWGSFAIFKDSEGNQIVLGSR